MLCNEWKEGGLKADAVFDGGGVRGIAHVGAYEVTWKLGYRFQCVAGASAGAIVASLIAAGYTPAELRQIMASTDYISFQDKTALARLPIIGPILAFAVNNGVYRGERFRCWLSELLAARGVRTFGDLVNPEHTCDTRYRYKLRVIAADITRGVELHLPQDIADYGVTPDSLLVADAVRMSMSIPCFFVPVKLSCAGHTCYVVDGGLLSSFPVDIFDDGTSDPPWPTFGYKLVDPKACRPHVISGPFSLAQALLATMLGAHDARYIKDHDYIRTVAIPTGDIQSTDFALAHEQVKTLYHAGKSAATRFFENWDFEQYKQGYRKKPGISRIERLNEL